MKGQLLATILHKNIFQKNWIKLPFLFQEAFLFWNRKLNLNKIKVRYFNIIEAMIMIELAIHVLSMDQFDCLAREVIEARTGQLARVIWTSWTSQSSAGWSQGSLLHQDQQQSQSWLPSWTLSFLRSQPTSSGTAAAASTEGVRSWSTLRADSLSEFNQSQRIKSNSYVFILKEKIIPKSSNNHESSQWTQYCCWISKIDN